MSSTRHISVRNDLAEIDFIAEETLQFCRDNDIAEDVYYDIRLALDEAVSNTIKYGYDDPQEHRIEVRLGLEIRKLVVEVEDDARPFDPLESPDPDVSLPIDRRPVGGLGIYLLRTVMDHVEYKRVGRKNILRMIRNTGGAEL